MCSRLDPNSEHFGYQALEPSMKIPCFVGEPVWKADEGIFKRRKGPGKKGSYFYLSLFKSM